MKKSLIALAVLAASGASFAQSTVTLYGLADVWVGAVKNETAGSSVTTTLMKSGGVNTSRFGFKGTEDLGGGLKANFQLEQGFALDTGAAGTSTAAQGITGTQAFDRQAWVGVSGGFGAVQVGKSWSAFDDVSGASNAMFDSGALAPMYAVFQSVNYIDRPVNGLKYISPNFGGFAGAVSYSLDEKVVAASKVSAINLTYGAGPVAAQFGYQVEEMNGNANDTKYTRLGGSYDFGMATAKLTYGKVTNVSHAAVDTTEYQIGADFPVGPALTLSASYAKSDDSNVGFEQSRKGYGVGAAYTLSKRTFLYGGYTTASLTKLAAADDKNSAFAVGVQHKF